MTEVVDPDVSRAYFIDMILDSDEHPHISYWGGLLLKYAHWTGSEWDIQTLSPNYYGLYNSIALKSGDIPAISHTDAYNYDCNYTYWDTDHWETEIVDDGNVGAYTSLAFDSQDFPHISYWYSCVDWLVYARWTGSEWTIEVLDNSCFQSSLALDSFDRPRIAYDSYYALMYTQWTGSEWVKEELDPCSEGVVWISMALNSLDNPCIAYGESNAPGQEILKYAWFGELNGIEPEDMIMLPEGGGMTISEPYPSPAYDIVTIGYSISNSCNVAMNIYDLSGRCIECPVCGEQDAGSHMVNWNCADASGGIYFVYLANGESILSKRIVILK